MTLDRRRVVARIVQKQFDEPVFFGYDFLPSLKDKFQSGRPFIYVDHAYFDRGYERGNFRIIRNDIHQRVLKPVRDSKSYEPDWQEWKRGGNHILILPPSQTMAETFGEYSWAEYTSDELRQYTDRPIVIKTKKDGPLEPFLKDCHAVVGFGTVASVEAVFHGIPVFCGPRCPATSVGLRDLSQIEAPWYGDREDWFKTLTWSQFSIPEIQSGLCREVLSG